MISVIPLDVFLMLLGLGAIDPAAVCHPSYVYVHGHKAPVMECVMTAELEEERYGRCRRCDGVENWRLAS